MHTNHESLLGNGQLFPGEIATFLGDAKLVPRSLESPAMAIAIVDGQEVDLAPRALNLWADGRLGSIPGFHINTPAEIGKPDPETDQLILVQLSFLARSTSGGSNELGSGVPSAYI